MKLLILGGSGFVSGTMARMGLKQGYDVTVLTRGRREAPRGTRVLIADRDDQAAFSNAISDARTTWDLVIDCIGFHAGHARQDLEVLGRRTRHLVFLSTDCVLDGTDRPWSVTETYNSFETFAEYGKNKRAAEVALLDHAAHRDGRGGPVVTILRPCHIYGPGSLLGCLPRHGRDPDLLERIRGGEPLRLVGGGRFLQQPVFAPDLAMMAFSCLGNEDARGETFHAAGPDVVESREYYRIIGDVLGVRASFEEIPVAKYLREEPAMGSFCCHRVYPMDKARSAGLSLPATSLREGLRAHVVSLLTSMDLKNHHERNR